jgi:sugar/nucleoside kinase (ribokinase family)
MPLSPEASSPQSNLPMAGSDSSAIDVIVSGHLCLDLIPSMEHVSSQKLTTPGRMSEVGPISVSTGGAVSNTGLALHRLGVNVRLMATVGDDLIGQMIIAYLNDRDEALSRFISVQNGQPGSYTVVLSPEHADRTFLHCTGTNRAFGIDDIDFSLLAQARIFHLGYPPVLPRLIADEGRELRALYERAKTTGVGTSMDMTLPDPQGSSGQIVWPRVLKHVLPYVDVFLPSVEEILFMMRRADYDAWEGKVLPHLTAAYLHTLAAELLDMGAVIVGFKLGEMGLYLRTADAARFDRLRKLSLDAAAWADVELWTPAYEVEVAGTTGAGDSAYAGFLAALLHGLSPLKAMRWACAVGACNVEAVDSTSGVRSWPETQVRMEAGWPTRRERLPGL